MIVSQFLAHYRRGEVNGPIRIHHPNDHYGVTIDFEHPKALAFHDIWKTRDGFRNLGRVEHNSNIEVSEKKEGKKVLQGVTDSQYARTTVGLQQLGTTEADLKRAIAELKEAGFTTKKDKKSPWKYVLTPPKKPPAAVKTR